MQVTRIPSNRAEYEEFINLVAKLFGWEVLDVNVVAHIAKGGSVDGVLKGVDTGLRTIMIECQKPG